ncbi:hypothetical protein MTsPCn5_17080 [Croceitalea sp. MTPC5]|uniref:Uncharacterized protein n=1 Tax=Croceitalea marina TaxID=1775166 RepID=A0ABW5MXX8_9FLAO|nr:hypothetical protein MTsPCn5_17080 [Croceitalea sp. MTPC5]
MHQIHIHFPCFEDFMDNAITFTIEMPYVPRIGDCISLDSTLYEHLERKIEKSDGLRKKYKRWIFGNGYCSFDDASVVVELSYLEAKKEIHIELGEILDEKQKHEY